MRLHLMVTAAAVAMFGLICQSQAATLFEMQLNGAQEVTTPPGGTNSTGSGFGTMELVDLGGGQYRWDYELTLSADFNMMLVDFSLNNGGRTVGGLHIHAAPRGQNGGVIYGLHSPDHDHSDSAVWTLNDDNTTTVVGSWTPLDGAIVGNINGYAAGLLALNPGDDAPFYWNVHTSAFAAGEIRGQIVAVPEPAAIGLAAAGLAMLAGYRMRRRER